MGGNNVKGLWLMETIYPPENGKSVIDPILLDKEIKKGNIKINKDPAQDQSVDDDMDEKIDRAIKEVWTYYDPKNTGVIPKKIVEKFIKDSLELYALRMGKKSSKEIIAPGINYGQAMESSIGKVSSTGQATFKQFEDFLNLYDIDEALGAFLNIQEVAVSASKVQFVDTSQFASSTSQVKKPVYRDYPTDD